MKNPLLDGAGIPPFAEIRPEFVTPAMDQLLADANEIGRASCRERVCT